MLHFHVEAAPPVFFVLSKSLDLALSPIVWVIALVALGMLLVVRRSPRRRLTLGAFAGAVAILLVAGNPTVANRLWWALESDAPSTYRADVTYDAVVLLGGVVSWGRGADGEAASYNDNVERLLVTADLLRADRGRIAIIAAGAPEIEGMDLAEAHVLARQLHAWKIPPERVIVEARSLNTRQNAQEVAAIVRDRSFEKVLVVTSAFHMVRAQGCFSAVGLRVDVLPVDRRALRPDRHGWTLAPRSAAFERTSDAVREYAGRIVYRILGYAR